MTKDTTQGETTHYSRLFCKFTSLSLICSLLPLLLAGWAINIHYSRFARERMMSTLQTRVEYHKRIIEIFLKETRGRLNFIAQTHSMEELIQPQRLGAILTGINNDAWTLTDIGIIDGDGKHRAYTGPYDLLDKNYSDTIWFKEVMEKGSYTSDMFMGFRKEPHFVMAVMKQEKKGKWILRATVNTEWFCSQVEDLGIGRTGKVYLLNEKGIYQTHPSSGDKIMSVEPRFESKVHDEFKFRRIKKDPEGQTENQIICETWLDSPRWLLLVTVDESELFSEIHHANRATLFSLHTSALIILLVIIWITRQMIASIKKRDLRVNQINTQLVQTGKLAAIGELSAGVAHEINNPLAIISTERQLLIDHIQNQTITESESKKRIETALEQINIQVLRCKHITRNLLKFARRTRSVIEVVDINDFIKEVVDLMEREASTQGIEFITHLEEKLPPILSDPSQLQQVFLNLINNAVEAHGDKGYGQITLDTRMEDNGIRIQIKDTGNGINPTQLNQIFDPFFTTKAPGKGTGLGLSICYSIVRQLGGTIGVDSTPEKGTCFTLNLPFETPGMSEN